MQHDAGSVVAGTCRRRSGLGDEHEPRARPLVVGDTGRQRRQPQPFARQRGGHPRVGDTGRDVLGRADFFADTPAAGFSTFGEILGISDNEVVAVICPLGYRDATDVYATKAKVRRPVSEFYSVK